MGAPLSYLVLARKYRPRGFDDLVGQEAVARGLSQAIASGRIGHAFLFVGSRGTGKTSTARILARALNCDKGPTANPCGECDSCRGIEDGTDVDVLEIDAASNNSVDNIRELREKIAFRPMRGRFRITILDEVHMLSTGAFNALLKTLEEPPAHAKFIFATTAPEKIPDTIRSRCQFFEFRRIDEAAIAARLAHVCKLENLQIEPAILSAIAQAARGGMRDSLSLLDQLVAFAGPTASEEDLARVMGTADRGTLLKIADAVLGGHRAELLQFVGDHTANGGEPVELLTQLADHFRACLTMALCGNDTDLVPDRGPVRDEIARQAQSAGPDRLEAIVRYFVSARERARFAGPLARASVECALMAASRSGEITTIPALLDRLLALERRIATGAPPPGAPMQQIQTSTAVTTIASAMSAAPDSKAGFQGAAELLELLATRNSFGRALKENMRSVRLDGNVLRITLRAIDDMKKQIVSDPVNRGAAERFLNDRVPGLIIFIDVEGSSVPLAAPGMVAPVAPPPPVARPAAAASAAAPQPPAPAGSPTPSRTATAPAQAQREPMASRVDENQLSKAARLVIESTRGRVLGQSPPPRDSDKS